MSFNFKSSSNLFKTNIRTLEQGPELSEYFKSLFYYILPENDTRAVIKYTPGQPYTVEDPSSSIWSMVNKDVFISNLLKLALLTVRDPVLKNHLYTHPFIIEVVLRKFSSRTSSRISYHRNITKAFNFDNSSGGRYYSVHQGLYYPLTPQTDGRNVSNDRLVKTYYIPKYKFKNNKFVKTIVDLKQNKVDGKNANFIKGKEGVIAGFNPYIGYHRVDSSVVGDQTRYLLAFTISVPNNDPYLVTLNEKGVKIQPKKPENINARVSKKPQINKLDSKKRFALLVRTSMARPLTANEKQYIEITPRLMNSLSEYGLKVMRNPARSNKVVVEYETNYYGIKDPDMERALLLKM